MTGESHFKIRSLLFFQLFAACLIAAAGGCTQQTDFTYGKSADQSINGVSVFANLLSDRGHSVVRKRRLTKRINKFDTIIWAPDNEMHPPENVGAWIEEWLAGSGSQTNKVLVYIGRAYDAKTDYYKGKAQTSAPEYQESWRRELAEVLVNDREYFWGSRDDEQEPYWFKKDSPDLIDDTKIAGPWSEEVDTTAINLNCDELLLPVENYNDESLYPIATYDTNDADNDRYDYVYVNPQAEFRNSELESNALLTVDGKPFAFEIRSKYGSGKIIVISNGSFLLNYALLNPEHQKLAEKVADEVIGDVVFLESAAQWPRVGGAADDPALQWTWIGKAPMTYIVPHFLFWGVLYCFAFYPNFGRPKRIKFHPPKAFRGHVKAVGAILSRSKEKSWAKEVIETWQKRNHKN